MSTTVTAVSQPPSALVMTALLPIMAVVLAVFFITGLSLPVVPLHVHQDLGLGAFIVGLVAGSQFGASLLSRLWAGDYSDTRGPKRAVMVGLVSATISGLLYLLSLRFVETPALSVTILLLGRAVLGAAEGLVITGAQSWGLALGGPENTGKVMAWVGIALFAAFAIGAPIGTGLYAAYGFAAIGLATAAVPLLAVLFVAWLPAVPPQRRARPAITAVIGAVSLPGLGAALSSAAFAVMTTFVVLLFADRGWNPAWLGFSVFAATLIVTRLLLGHLADRLGGAQVALVSVVIEAAGLALIGLAPWPALALVGAAITGVGYSLVYPGFAVEAIGRAPLEYRGLAAALYTAFLDVALAITTPVLGLIAGWTGFGSVFLASGVIALGAAPVAAVLLVASHRPQSTD